MMTAMVSAADQRIPGSAPPVSTGPSGYTAVSATNTNLQPYVTTNGRISYSIDGAGYTASSGIIQVQKPAGATVRKAYMAAATTGYTSYKLPAGSVKINGNNVVWQTEIANDISSYNYMADVTTIVKPIVDSAPAGMINIPVSEADSSDTEGEILVVIFDDPNVLTDNSVILLFGAQKTTGDTFWLSLARPYDPQVTKNISLSLGISYSYQVSDSQYSIIDVNTRRLTTWAGGEDDGQSANGALLTVGGINDTIANPPDPYATKVGNFRYDDELYDLRPFVTTGSQAINVTTKNPSMNDNIFFGAFYTEGNNAIVGEGITLSPTSATTVIGTSYSVKAYVQNDLGKVIPNRQVNFSITSGPNSPKTGRGTTDSTGVTYFTYTGTTVGTDTIVATMIDSDGEVSTSNTVTSTWTSSSPTTGADKIGVFRSGTWLLDYNGNGKWDGAVTDRQYSFGTSIDMPAVGDWNANGKTKIGIQRYGSTWLLDYNGNGKWDGAVTDRQYTYGVDDQNVVYGDWNGDGKAEIGIARLRNNGLIMDWYLDYNGNGLWEGTVTDRMYTFSLLDTSATSLLSSRTNANSVNANNAAATIPVVGDWNGNGKSEIGLYLYGLFFLDYNGNGQWDGVTTDRQYSFGQYGDKPVAGKWNGGTKSEIAVFRNGVWYLDYNGNGQWDGSTTDRQYSFGTTVDKPVAGNW